MKQRSLIFPVLAGLALAAAPAWSQSTFTQDIKFASTPNPVGSGGRAVGWGSAFIAVADDATAASWNPAGLVQLETPECSVVLSYLHRSESIEFERYASEGGGEAASHGDINYASFAYPFSLGPVNLVPSLNYQRLYEFDRKMEFTLRGSRLLPVGEQEISERATLEQVGALTTLTPALGVQVTPQFSLGASFNFWGQDPLGDGWTQRVQVRSAGVIDLIGARIYGRAESKETYKFQGWNWQAGFLFKPGNFSFGGVYKAGFDADIDYTEEISTSQWSPTHTAFNTNPVRFKREEDETIRWPAAYGLGIGYRVSDAFSLAVDAYRTEWSTFELKDEQGRTYNLIAGRVSGPNDVPDTTQVRAGMEYLIIKPKAVVALRGGGFWDPEPREDDTVDFYGLTLGTGFGVGHWVVDVAYQYRFGWNVPQEKSLGDQAKADVSDRFVIASVIYHFK